MDVICERCKAEYEFDEALLGEKGTTVKCSACGHVFRVLPPHRDLARSHLKLRFAKDGTVKALGSLRELQQRIRAGEVTLDDELGRDGFPFRPLHDVPELKNFFAPPSETHTLRPDAGPGMLAGNAARTVVGGVPGSAAATLTGQPEPRTGSGTSVRPPLPSERARARTETLEALERAAHANETDPEPVDADYETVDDFADNVRSEAEPQPGPHRDSLEEAVAEESEPTPVPVVAVHAIREPALASKNGSSTRDWVPPEARPRSFNKGTMMGVGPNELQLPPPPRMPSFNAGSPEAARPIYANGPAAGAEPAINRPYNDSPHATISGAPAPAPTHGANGTPPKPSVASASFGRGGTLAPAAAAPEPVSELVAPEQVPSNRISEYPDEGALRSNQPGVGDVPPPPVLDVPDAARKLYLAEGEKEPKRAREGTSKFGLTMLIFAVLSFGGYLFWRAYEGPEGEWGPGEPLAPTSEEALDSTSTGVNVPLTADRAPAKAPSELAAAPSANTAPAADVVADSAAAANTPAASAVTAPVAPTAPAAPSSPAAPRANEAPSAVAKSPPVVEPTPAKTASALVPNEPEKPVVSAPEPKPSAKPTVAKPKPVSDPIAEAAPKPAAAERLPAPGDYSGLVTRGDQLFARGDSEGAQKAFRAALAARPQGSEANAGLGFALYAAGQTRDALPYFDAAATSGYADANIGLGDCYRKLGQSSSAIEAYQAYIDRLPRGQRADYARAQIDKLKGGSKGDAPNSEPAAANKPKPGDGYRPAGELIAPANP